MSKTAYTREKVDEIVAIYHRGANATEIATRFGTYNTTIRRILIREGITLRGPSETNSRIKKNPFEDLNKDAVQYWLGYIIADGNVSEARNRINISTVKDPEHLKKYIEFLGIDLKISEYFNKKYSTTEYSVNFQNKAVKEYLVSLGITPRKSLTMELKIPLTFAMLRGVFDGDGYVRIVGKSTVSVEFLTASRLFSNQILDLLTSNQIKCSYSAVNNQHKGVHIVRVGQRDSVRKLYSLMYDDASVFLKRKADIWVAGLETDQVIFP